MTEEQPTAPRAGVHRWRMTILAFVIGFAVLGAAVAFLLFGGEKPRATSPDEALERYRSGTAVPATAPDGTSPPGTSATQDRLTLPAPGLYRYTGSGTEETSFPPLREQQGPDMPATVAHDASGCWTFRIDYNTHHWQDWTLCPSGDGLASTTGHSFARRDLGAMKVDNLATSACDPAAMWLWTGMQPGDTRPSTCTGSSTLVPETTTWNGTYTFVGDEVVDVGGTPVPARHVRYEGTLSGGQTGPEATDWWLAADTGLPVRQERRVEVRTATPFGTITYTEQARFELASVSVTT